MRYALIKNNTVENIIEAESEFVSTLASEYQAIIDITENNNIHIGTGYENNNFVIPEPVVIPDPDPVPKQYSLLEYQSLYTLEELIAIEIASETDATIRVLQRLQQSASYISLADPRTIQGMQTLVSKNLLTQARYDEIISKTYA